jgi:penicillin-binding protein 1A
VIRRRAPEAYRRLASYKPDLAKLTPARLALRRQAARLGPGLRGVCAGKWPGLSRRGKWVSALSVLLVCLVGGIAGTLMWALHDLPAEAATDDNEPAIILETADGQALARKGPFKAPDVALAGFPNHLVDAVLSIEDRRFYSHSGVDMRGILRALTRNIRAGQVVEGGSTITQQLVKIRYLDREETLKRKIREAYLAIRLDMRLGKDEILTDYLNNVYLGAGATGIPAAAKVYFDKDAVDLTLAESALLAGLIKAPSQLNPLRDLQAARTRAAVVLDAMVASGKLEPAVAEGAKNNPAALAPSRVPAHSGTWFADWAFEEAAEIAGSFRGTMRVRTTLVPELQAAAEKVVAEALAGAGETSGVTQAALVALRPDGAVLAMVGGRDYSQSEFNRAVDAMRQPGSTFKLFVYSRRSSRGESRVLGPTTRRASSRLGRQSCRSAGLDRITRFWSGS